MANWTLADYDDWAERQSVGYARETEPKKLTPGDPSLSSLLEQYRQSMESPGVSPVELQMQQAMGRQIAGQHALAASMPGVSPGLASRIASRGAQRAMSDTSMQTGVLRAKEEQARQQMYGDWLSRLYLGNLQSETQRYMADRSSQAAKDAANRQLWGSIIGGGAGLAGTLLFGGGGSSAGNYYNNYDDYSDLDLDPYDDGITI